jgi:hypothetical protein
VGLFRKTNINNAPAAIEVRFGAHGVATVEWHGAPEILVRSPAIYLDWAVSKDDNRRAAAFLTDLRDFLEAEEPGHLATPLNAPLVRGLTRNGEAAEVSVALTESMLCKPSFRPRMAIVQLMYPTFWALWNEMARRVGADEPETVEALVNDMFIQIDYYATRGTAAMRGGHAHLYAAQVGSADRLAVEVDEQRMFGDPPDLRLTE